MSHEVRPTKDAPNEIACDALVVAAIPRDGGIELLGAGAAADASLDGRLTEALLAKGFGGSLGEVAGVDTLGRSPASSVVAAGLGDRVSGENEVRRAAGAAIRRLRERSEIVCDLHSPDVPGATAAVVEGFLLGSYRTKSYGSGSDGDKPARILLPGADAADIERGTILADATNQARDLTDRPPDRLTPRAFAQIAKGAATTHGLDCRISDKSELEELGFGGILAVARGSDEPPRLIDLRYQPAQPRAKVTLVGKGVTYDSGGLTLKPAASLVNMKTDMAGGASVLAAIIAAARLELPVEVRVLIPSTENMIGPDAMRVDEVITHYGGRTTEVTNTDAEGRLILADALAYASEEETDAIVDIATLTGSIKVALGLRTMGMFSDDDPLATALLEAASSVDEQMWRMPMFPDLRSSLDSDVADLKNSGKRWGGASIAALYLRSFVDGAIPWAHLDIAGAARKENADDFGPRGASGVGTRTLIRWLESLDR